MNDSKNKVAIITGGGSGIGKASAVALANDGYYVVITGRREGPLNNTVKEIGGDKVFAITCDVGHPESVKNLFSKTLDVLKKSSDFELSLFSNAITPEK